MSEKCRIKMSEKCRIKNEREVQIHILPLPLGGGVRGGALHLHECADVSAFFESCATVKTFVRNLDEEVYVDLLWIELLHEVVSCAHSTASSEKVVVEKDYIVLINGVAMDFDSVCAVFLCIALLNSVSRKLAWLATEDNTCAKSNGEC